MTMSMERDAATGIMSTTMSMERDMEKDAVTGIMTTSMSMKKDMGTGTERDAATATITITTIITPMMYSRVLASRRLTSIQSRN